MTTRYMDRHHMWTELQTSMDVWECMYQNVAIGHTSHERTGFGSAQGQREWLPNWMQVIFVSLVSQNFFFSYPKNCWMSQNWKSALCFCCDLVCWEYCPEMPTHVMEKEVCSSSMQILHYVSFVNYMCAHCPFIILHGKKIKFLALAVISSRRQCRTLHRQNEKSMFYRWFNLN